LNSTINVKLPRLVKTLSAALFAYEISLQHPWSRGLHCDTTMLSSDKWTGGYAVQTEYVLEDKNNEIKFKDEKNKGKV
jgi:hypothetical protein